MMTEIERQSWLKDGVSQLSLALSGDLSLKGLPERDQFYLSLCQCRKRHVVFLRHEGGNVETAFGAFAFTERAKLRMPTGSAKAVVAQVALERAPILLKHPDAAGWPDSDRHGQSRARTDLHLPAAVRKYAHGVIEFTGDGAADVMRRIS